MYDTGESGEVLKSRSQHWLVATKGNPPIDPNKRLHSWMNATAETGTRSPSMFYTGLETAYEVATRLDVFPDKEREGWTRWVPGMD